MIPKEAYWPQDGSGEVASIQESQEYICHFVHEWEFSQNGKGLQESEAQLRAAIRHVVWVKHEIDGTIYGGLKYDESLSQKLSISFFQKAGLLKPLVVRFSGHIDEMINFAFREDVVEPINNNGDCKHHWLIETPKGPTSPGRCKYCGAEDVFRNSSDDHIWEDASRTASSEPSSIHQLVAAGSLEFD